MNLTTIERHIAETQRRFPEARGSFSGLLNNIAFATRLIASQVRRAGLVDVLVISGVNPAADLPGAKGMAAAIAKAKLVISTAPLADETSALARWICPEAHALESWNDGEPAPRLYTLTQPTVPPMRSARTL